MNNSIKFIAIGFSIAFLGACGVSPGFGTNMINFSSPDTFLVLQNKFTGPTQLAVNSNPIAESVKASVQGGTLFIGDKTFKSGKIVDAVYQWTVPTPCASLPAGENILMRYELYSANGSVLQKNSVNIPKISVC